MKSEKLVCPVSKRCGGCHIHDIDYQSHLHQKQQIVQKFIGSYCRNIEPIIGMTNPYNYRNKVHAVFRSDRSGNIISGVYEPHSHKVVPVNNCLIENQKADEIIGTIRSLLKSFRIKTYDEDNKTGLFRHVLIRTGHRTKEIMVVLVLSSPVFPSKHHFVDALLAAHAEITTIVMNVNDRRTSMILGDKEQVLYGKGTIDDQLCGKNFRISPKSFYQVNPIQTEVLYGKALEFAGLTGEETVLDAYCGIGTIGLIASDHAKMVYGVEANKDAVYDAIENAKRNHVGNIRFFASDAGMYMRRMVNDKIQIHTVFMDPPRTGSDHPFLNSLVAVKPKQVVYISFNPETLSQDLHYLIQKGYAVIKAAPVDMFPWTEHVETVALLSHKDADGFINVKMEYEDGVDRLPERVTYGMIQAYVEGKYGFKVHTAYIAEVKRLLGLPMYDAPNAVDELKHPYKPAPAHKVEAIKDALKHFGII